MNVEFLCGYLILIHILCLNRVLDRLKQSPDIPMQATAQPTTAQPTTDHVVTSSQPTVPTSPYISDQSNVPAQTTMPTQLQQMGLSSFNGTFPHLTG